MAAIDYSLVARSEAALHHYAKRNWASQEKGVIVVFAIVGCVAILVIGLFVQKKVSRDIMRHLDSKLMGTTRWLRAKRPHKDTPSSWRTSWTR
jgi:hypothetical protein